MINELSEKRREKIRNQFKVLEKEYDDNGNIIYYKSTIDGSEIYEQWGEYDDKGRLIYNRYSDGRERWWDHNEQGKLTHLKLEPEGHEHWVEYDERGNKIHFKNNAGEEKWWEYNENNELIHYKRSDGYEEWIKYEKNEKKVDLSFKCEQSNDSDDIEKIVAYKSKNNK